MSIVKEFTNKLEQVGSQGGKLSAVQIAELCESYQELCNFYSYQTTFFPNTLATKAALKAVLEGRKVLYGSIKEPESTKEHSTIVDKISNSFASLANYVSLSFVLMFATACLTYSIATVDPSYGWKFLSSEVSEDLENGILWTESINSANAINASRIAVNNIAVCFRAFVFGLAGCVGTFILLLTNGAMLGGGFAMVSHYGLEAKLLDFIFAHGVLELSVIIVTSGCGLYLGDALIKPGKLTRKAALRSRAKSSLTVFIFSLLCLIPAGLVEGFISPSNGIPFSYKCALGIFLGGVYWMILLRSSVQKIVCDREISKQKEI